MKPLYIIDHYTEPALGDYYLTHVHIREHLEASRGLRSRSMHNSATPHTTYAASISNAAKRDLWSLCYCHH
jgi:hypothetical protein